MPHLQPEVYLDRAKMGAKTLHSMIVSLQRDPTSKRQKRLVESQRRALSSNLEKYNKYSS